MSAANHQGDTRQSQEIHGMLALSILLIYGIGVLIFVVRGGLSFQEFLAAMSPMVTGVVAYYFARKSTKEVSKLVKLIADEGD